jgi:hypothetical protein
MIGWSGNAIPRRNPMPHLCTPAVLQCQTSCQKWAGLNACVWILRYHCTTPARLTGGKEQLTSFHCVGFVAQIGKSPREKCDDPCRSLGLKRQPRLSGRPSRDCATNFPCSVRIWGPPGFTRAERPIMLVKEQILFTTLCIFTD